MKRFHKPIAELLTPEGQEQCPLTLSVIPNYMGINLCAVEAITWQEQDDGQLISLTIEFIPEERAAAPKAQSDTPEALLRAEKRGLEHLRGHPGGTPSRHTPSGVLP